MSGTFPPPPPLGLPPPHRVVRSLRKWPLYVVTGVVVVVCSATWWGMSHIGVGRAHGVATTEADHGSADATAVLSGAPTGNVIAAAYRSGAPVVPVQGGAPLMVPIAPAPIDDDQTEAAIAARKAAWDNYYKAKADVEMKRRDARLASLTADMDATAPVTPPAASDITGGIAGMVAAAQGQQQQSPDFFKANASNPATDYSPFTTTNPISRYELKAGDIITARLITGINSDSPGLVKAIVTKTITDHATGMNILIPQGSTLIGVYDRSISYGQTRLITAWQRIIFPPPCDQSLDLGAMAGSDQSGRAGFEDITNNHWSLSSAPLCNSRNRPAARCSSIIRFRPGPVRSDPRWPSWARNSQGVASVSRRQKRSAKATASACWSRRISRSLSRGLTAPAVQWARRRGGDSVRDKC
jgi:type IV secretory pathway VirB10-like protein